VNKMERFADRVSMSYLVLQKSFVHNMLIISFLGILMAEGFIIVRRSKK